MKGYRERRECKYHLVAVFSCRLSGSSHAFSSNDIIILYCSCTEYTNSLQPHSSLIKTLVLTQTPAHQSILLDSISLSFILSINQSINQFIHLPSASKPVVLSSPLSTLSSVYHRRCCTPPTSARCDFLLEGF